MATSKPIVVIGVGNECRKDDRVGLFVSRGVARMKLPHVSVLEGVHETTELIDRWTGAEVALVVDAVACNGAPGAIYRFEARHEPLPECLFPGCSTHLFSLRQAVELARVLDRLPGQLIVYGIAGVDFGFGSDMTQAVQRAGITVVDYILSEIGNLRRARGRVETGPSYQH